MVSKIRRGVRGSRVKSVQNECWQVRSQLMAEKSGHANSVRNRMCGRGGVAGAVAVTSCGLRGKDRQAVAARSGERLTGSTTSSGEGDRKTRSLEAENKELRARIDALEKKGGDGVQGEQSIPSRKEGDLEDVWGEERRWTSRMRLRAARSWMSKRKNCRSYEMSKDCHGSPKKQRRVSKSPLQHQLQEVEKRRPDLMPEHQKGGKDVVEDILPPGQKKKLAEGKCGSTRRDAEDQRRKRSQ